jgi:hypothetical protein
MTLSAAPSPGSAKTATYDAGRLRSDGRPRPSTTNSTTIAISPKHANFVIPKPRAFTSGARDLACGFTALNGHGFSRALEEIYSTLSFRAKLNPPPSGGFNAVEEPAVSLQRLNRRSSDTCTCVRGTFLQLLGIQSDTLATATSPDGIQNNESQKNRRQL